MFPDKYSLKKQQGFENISVTAKSLHITRLCNYILVLLL